VQGLKGIEGDGRKIPPGWNTQKKKAAKNVPWRRGPAES
jgi:hypothetical protein